MTPTKQQTLPLDMNEEFSPEELALAEQYANKGASTSAEDTLVPLVNILQKLSPQVESTDSRYVEGAKAGDIWLRGAAIPIIKGSEGMVFQPCYFSIDWIEWVPRERGGGFVARYKSDPANPTRPPVRDARPDGFNPPRKFTRDDGNEIVQTRTHWGWVLNNTPMRYVIPLQGSGHMVSKSWHNLIHQHAMRGGDSFPAWFFIYRLFTRQRTNSKGTWYVFDIKNERRATKAEIERGQKSFDSFETQQFIPEMPQELIEHDDDGDSANL